MNNRGQTLVLFLIIIPVIIFLFICFYQIGMMKIEEKKIIGTIEEALEYGVQNLENEYVYMKIEEIITDGSDLVNDEDIEVTVGYDEINIIVEVDFNTILVSNEIVFDYTGRLINGELEIVENRGW